MHIFETMHLEFEITRSNEVFSFYLNVDKSCREAMLSIYCPRNSFICCHIIAVYFHIWCTRFKYLFLGIKLSIRHAFITFYKYKISRLRVLRWTKNFDLKYIKLINSLFALRVITIYQCIATGTTRFCKLTLSGVDAHITIASDSIPLILEGFKLHIKMAFLFCISSSGMNFTNPDITVLSLLILVKQA